MAKVPVVVLNKIDDAVLRVCQVLNPDTGELYTGGLPPINKIVIPHGKTKTVTIRWLHAMGYTVGEIYHHLSGVKYQMVRNIITTVPKRAAREDVPPLVAEWLPEVEFIDMALDAELERSLLTRDEDNQEEES